MVMGNYLREWFEMRILTGGGEKVWKGLLK
jgi:hypothetical protein